MGFFRDLFGGAERDAAKIQAAASDKAIAEQRRARVLRGRISSHSPMLDAPR